MTRHATILATGRYVPERLVTNDDLRARFERDFPEFVSKMEQSTGIKQRYHARDDMATSDVALPAALQALERAGKRPEDVDLIILGTDSPDYITPATSVVLQHKLGAKNAGTFDVGCACASFPTGLSIGSGLIAANPALKTILVVGVYLMQRLADPNDPMIFFYGDGAGAAVLGPGSEPGFLGSAFRADGSYAKNWSIAAGGTVEPATHASIDSGRARVKMYDRYPPEINDEGWPAVTRSLAANAGFAVSDIDMAIFTQVRSTTIEKVMATLGLPLERTHMIMDKWGYTGSACVGMALDDAILAGKIRTGDLVAMVGSGVGYNQAAVAFRMA